jgi:hypothetical protein|tara:strand:- start:598 stop:777 length:180 start_codon:yes stop_codon:yes gene_type:complete
MAERNKMESIKALVDYLEDSPMVCEVMSIANGIAVIKFNLEQEYTYRITQKGVDKLGKK